MTDQDESPPDEFRHDRRVHGGMPERLDDDQLARLAEEERVAAGIDPYDPGEVPPATDEPPEVDLGESEVYQEARAELRREESHDELLIEGERDPYPPAHYDE